MSKRSPLDVMMLAQFTGSTAFYRHGLAPNVVFTDGAKYVADEAGAYWLIDEIALAQHYASAVAGEEFQVWDLTVADDESALLTCGDGNDHVVLSKQIPWTDFPAPGIRLFACNGTIMLPGEY